MISIGGILLLNLCLIVILILIFQGLKNIISATLFDFSFLYQIFISVVAPLIVLIVNIIIYCINKSTLSIIIIDILMKYFVLKLLMHYVKVKRMEFTQYKFQDIIKKIVIQKFKEYGIFILEDNIGILIRNNKAHLYCKVIIKLDLRLIDEYILVRIQEDLERNVKSLDSRMIFNLDIKE